MYMAYVRHRSFYVHQYNPIYIRYHLNIVYTELLNVRMADLRYADILYASHVRSAIEMRSKLSIAKITANHWDNN